MPSRAPRLRWSLAAGLLACLANTRPARGQAVGYQLNRFEPTPAGDPFAVVESPWYSATRWLAGGLTLDYAYSLLAAELRDPAGNPISAPSPIAHHQGGHLDLAGSLFDRVALSLSVPIVLSQSGTAFAGIGPSGTVAGDPRIGVRARLYGQPDTDLSVSAAAYLWIPIGAEDALAGDEGARGMARLTFGGLARARLRWAANASFLARETARLSSGIPAVGNTVGNEVQLAAGVSYVGLDGKLSVGPEALLAVGVAGDRPAGQDDTSLEAFGTARYQLRDDLRLGVGVGVALVGTGLPEARALFSITYAPVRPRGSSFERVIVLPDEDGHVGGVEVDDGKRKTLLDTPYASTEIRRKDARVRAVQSSPQTLPPRAAELAKTLPPSDRDRDSILDAQDGCPDRAGAASADPIRHGCPAAVEKVVVLPDEDGHVGGVEVDDGRTKTLIDQPYASAEVGADGAVRAVPPAPPHAVERTVAAVARTLPPPDADGDGILDHDDACPDRAGATSPDPIRHGCPASAERVVVLPDADGHIGGVEVDDGRTKTLIDQPYASVEVAPDGVAHALPPASPRAVDRSIASIARALPIADTDRDGVRDEQDACPDDAGRTSSDPLRHGCPPSTEKVVVLPDADGHVGAVEIDDGKHKVLLDTAYATAEVRDGRAQAATAAPAPVISRATAAIGKALPAPDRDDDGVVDREDACPDRGGPPSSQPSRHGCPRSVEHVVVLPDENGHVGAIEVDDGQTKTVLDQAYASAEVGADGRARMLPAEPAEVSARFAEAMAARPAGARIILYFTARSEPARDLTGPIENLVAEVKTKTDYTIEVIGHTDQTGSERTNLKIGRERAQLIADRLISAGVPREHVNVKSMGSKEPAIKLKNRRTVELRNRRVEIWVR